MGWTPTVEVGVYGLFNVVSSKVYVGQSSSMAARWRYHLSRLRNRTHPNEYLQRAFNKYGEGAFEPRVIEETEVASLNPREIFWVAYHKADVPEFGYNMRAGGECGGSPSAATRAKIAASHTGMKGPSPSPETRKKISDALRGRKNPRKPGQQEKIMASQRGRPRKPLSEATRLKIGNANRGKKLGPMPDKNRAAISAALRGRSFSEAHRNRLSLKALEREAARRSRRTSAG